MSDTKGAEPDLLTKASEVLLDDYIDLFQDFAE